MDWCSGVSGFLRSAGRHSVRRRLIREFRYGRVRPAPKASPPTRRGFSFQTEGSALRAGRCQRFPARHVLHHLAAEHAVAHADDRADRQVFATQPACAFGLVELGPDDDPLQRRCTGSILGLSDGQPRRGSAPATSAMRAAFRMVRAMSRSFRNTMETTRNLRKLHAPPGHCQCFDN